MNRIWIELDKPKDDAHAQEIVRLANNMLRRLFDVHKDVPLAQAFEYAGGAFHFGSPVSGTTELADRGMWFSLDYLGRD